jgi:hypothetical protein
VQTRRSPQQMVAEARHAAWSPPGGSDAQAHGQQGPGRVLQPQHGPILLAAPPQAEQATVAQFGPAPALHLQPPHRLAQVHGSLGAQHAPQTGGVVPGHAVHAAQHAAPNNGGNSASAGLQHGHAAPQRAAPLLAQQSAPGHPAAWQQPQHAGPARGAVARAPLHAQPAIQAHQRLQMQPYGVHAALDCPGACMHRLSFQL